jgi:hypothetical protein
VFLLDRTRHYDDFLRPEWRQREASICRVDTRHAAKRAAQAADFDAQARSVRFVDELRSEGLGKEHVARYVARPRSGQSSCEGEQDRAGGKRDYGAGFTHGVAARVDDQGFGCKQGRNVFEQERPFLAPGDTACGRGIQDEECSFDLGAERWYIRAICRLGSAG